MPTGYQPDAMSPKAERPYARISGVVLDSLDAQELAGFYQALLGWVRVADEPGWVKIAPEEGAAGLSFASEPTYVRPVWPSTTTHQQMMTHLDIEVRDLEAAGAFVIEHGAQEAAYQPQTLVRVYADPAGHPFCLWVRP
jgi:catechol 2,3-dioxygenase-like lactoylglutathione lyase family enzyme